MLTLISLYYFSICSLFTLLPTFQCRVHSVWQKSNSLTFHDPFRRNSLTNIEWETKNSDHVSPHQPLWYLFLPPAAPKMNKYNNKIFIATSNFHILWTDRFRRDFFVKFPDFSLTFLAFYRFSLTFPDRFQIPWLSLTFTDFPWLLRPLWTLQYSIECYLVLLKSKIIL